MRVITYHVLNSAVFCLVFEALESILPVKFAEEHLYPPHTQDSENLVQYLKGVLLHLLYQCSFEMNVAHTKSSFCRMLELLLLLRRSIRVK